MKNPENLTPIPNLLCTIYLPLEVSPEPQKFSPGHQKIVHHYQVSNTYLVYKGLVNSLK